MVLTPLRHQLRQYLKRILHPASQLDFQQAFFTMRYLLVLDPANAFKMNRRVMQTKGHFYRDDPAFLVLFAWIIICTSLGYFIAFEFEISMISNTIYNGIGNFFYITFFAIGRFIRFGLWMVCVDFLICGIIMSTIGYIVGNKYLRADSRSRGASTLDLRNNTTTQSNSIPPRSSRMIKNFEELDSELDDLSYDDIDENPIHLQYPERLEWLYCFDIHLNAFFGFYSIIYIAQFLLLPILLRDNFFSLIIGNTLYALGFANYFFITFFGYQEIKFLTKTEVFITPIAFIVLVWIFSLIFQVHVVDFVIYDLYFGC